MTDHLDALRSLHAPTVATTDSALFDATGDEACYGDDYQKTWVHPRETPYFVLSVLFSLILYLLFYFIFFQVAVVALFGGLIAHGLFMGYLRGKGIRVGKDQLPQVYDAAVRFSGRLGLKSVPEIYVLQSGGVLNAFATRFVGRDCVILYSDMVELAYEKGQPALEFIIGHELGHIKRGHTSLNKYIWTLPASCIPFLGTAYSRACEYTADRFGLELQPEGAIDGLLVLAAGKKLYQRVNTQELIRSSQQSMGLWGWFAEILEGHPHLANRIKALMETGNARLPEGDSDLPPPLPAWAT